MSNSNLGPMPGGFDAPGVVPFQDQSSRGTGAVAEGLGRAGLGITIAADELQAQFDRALTTRMDNEFSAAIAGELNPFLETRNLNTLEAAPEVLRRLEKVRESIGSRLTNDRQRAAFNAVAAQRMIDVGNVVSKHRAAEQREFAIDEDDKARVLAMGQFMLARKTGDMALAKDHFDSAVAKAHTTADAMQLPLGSAQRKLMVRDTTSSMHLGALQAYADAKDVKGFAEYAATVDPQQLAPEAADMVSKLQATLADDDKALRLERELAALPYAQRQSKLDALFDGGKISADLYKRTREGVDRAYQREQVVDAAERRRLTDAYTVFLDNNRAAAAEGRAGLLGFDGLPASMREELKSRGMAVAAERYAESGRFVTTADGDKLLRMFVEMAQREPGEIRKTPFATIRNSLRPVLSDEDLGEVERMWNVLQRPDTKAPFRFSVRTQQDEIGRMVEQFAPRPADYAKLSDAEKQAQIEREQLVRDRMQEAVDAVQPKNETDAFDALNAWVDKERLRVARPAGSTGAFTPLVTMPQNGEPLEFQVQTEQGPTLVRTDRISTEEIGRVRQEWAISRDKAAQAGDQAGVARYTMLLGTNDPVEMASAVGRLRVAARRAQPRAGVARAQAQPPAAVSRETRIATAAQEMDAAWAQEVQRRGGRDTSAWQRWWWEGAEAARRENAARWPDDPMFSYDRWHGWADRREDSIRRMQERGASAAGGILDEQRRAAQELNAIRNE